MRSPSQSNAWVFFNRSHQNNGINIINVDATHAVCLPLEKGKI
jgi:hypothetical protein